jgi:hypothetical protein
MVGWESARKDYSLNESKESHMRRCQSQICRQREREEEMREKVWTVLLTD